MNLRREQGPGVSKVGAYRWYVLLLLFLVLTLSFVDRQIMAILQQSIKEDLRLSDTQLGLLTGVAFNAFYIVVGVWVARMADIHSRARILVCAVFVWSLMTIFCGFAVGYATLFLARIGVGIGEAGGSPPAHSVISDYFPPAQRATALGLYALGMPLGSVIAFTLGGYIDVHYGWRAAFFVAGPPGILLAALTFWTLREPLRGATDPHPPPSVADRPSLRETLRTLAEKRSFGHLAVASGLHAFLGVGVVTWLPSFLIRSHNLTTFQAGTVLAVLVGVFGVLGSSLGGYLCDRAAKADRRWYVWLPAIAVAVAGPFAAAAYLADDLVTVCVLLAVPLFLGHFHLGSVFATAQGLSPTHMRATAAAVLMFVNGVFALGVGPIATGVVSDLLEPRRGSGSLRMALAIVTMVIAVWAALQYLQAARRLELDA